MLLAHIIFPAESTSMFFYPMLVGTVGIVGALAVGLVGLITWLALV